MFSPSQFGSLDRASACRLNSPRFDSCQGHRWGLRAPSPLGGVWEAADPWFSVIDVSTSLSLPLPPKKQIYVTDLQFTQKNHWKAILYIHTDTERDVQSLFPALNSGSVIPAAFYLEGEWAAPAGSAEGSQLLYSVAPPGKRLKALGIFFNIFLLQSLLHMCSFFSPP